MGDYFDYLNRADFNVVRAACQFAADGDGEDTEFQDSIAAVLDRIAKRHGLTRRYQAARVPFEKDKVSTLMAYLASAKTKLGYFNGFAKAAPLSNLRRTGDAGPSA